MAFGGIIDTGVASGTSIVVDPTPVTMGGTVAIGDLVIAVFSQETALTVTAVTDTLLNTYVGSNIGSDAGEIAGRMFYSVVTTAGVLATVNFDITTSSNNFSAAVVIFEGPFVASPVDQNPANATIDDTAGTPLTTPASGVLAQAQELVVSWVASSADPPGYDGVGVGTLGLATGVSNSCVAIAYTVTAATTSITHTFTASGGFSDEDSVTGTTSFKAETAAPVAGFNRAPTMFLVF